MKFAILIVLVLLISVPKLRAQGEEEVFDDEEGEGFEEGEGDYVEGEEGEEEKPEPEPTDPCIGVECGYGKQCVANEEGEGICKCIQSCRHKAGYGERFQVCSNQNETFDNICEMEKAKCMCDGGEDGCDNQKHKNVELSYYGRCRGALQCPEEIYESFPMRIRAWLRNVMIFMAGRNDLSRSEQVLAQRAVAESNGTVIPVLWKFCYLDNDPSDGQISQGELLPLVAQLHSLEDCSQKFFKTCDKDSSKGVSLNEFGSCFGLEDEEIEDVCKEIEVDEPTEDGPEPGFLRESK